ncbi:MAG TPA: IS4 family transposase [Gaiellaceae bacterium]|nr:IS4 family transposase [Gaiellaceae bacterium]
MAASQRTSIPAELRSLFPTRWLNTAARECGLVTRRRKVAPAHLFWTLVLGFAVGHRRSLASLRRFFQASSGVGLAPSSFYDRFTASTVRFLRRALVRAAERLGQPSGKLRGHLDRFKDLLVADATVIRLHDALARAFPGCRTNHTRAAAKLHVVMSALGAGPRSVSVTGERINERRRLKIGPWVAGRLLLFDLGYFRWQLFDRIRANGGYFISRLRDDVNPVIVAENRRWRGASRKLVGQRLREVKLGLAREAVDVLVEVELVRRSYRDRCRREREIFRVVGVRHGDAREHHWYVTNVPVTVLSPAEIATTYAARWEIELVFRELKTHLRLAQVASRRRVVVEALIYAALIGLAVSRAIWRRLRALVDAGRRISERRVTDALGAIAAELAVVLAGVPISREQVRRWHALLSAEAADPNVGRATMKRAWGC